MKKSLLKLVLGIAAILAIMQIQVQAATVPPPPSTGTFLTTASGPHNAVVASKIRPAIASYPSAAISLAAIISASYQSQQSWSAAISNAVYDAKAGLLTTNATISLPTQYAVCNYHIAWPSLVYSYTNPEWNGILNPASPFDSQLGGPDVGVIIVARATSGGDDISLDMLSITGFSNDGNQLGGALTFGGDSYTSLAIGVMVDGTLITSGSASQKCEYVILWSQSKLFNNGDTQSGLDQDNSWVSSFHPYNLTYTAQIIGDNSTISSTTVSTAPSPTVPPISSLKLSILSSGSGTMTMSIPNASTNFSYSIGFKSSLARSDSWQLFAVVQGTNSFSAPISTSGDGFYKVIGVQ